VEDRAEFLENFYGIAGPHSDAALSRHRASANELNARKQEDQQREEEMSRRSQEENIRKHEEREKNRVIPKSEEKYLVKATDAERMAEATERATHDEIDRRGGVNPANTMSSLSEHAENQKKRTGVQSHFPSDRQMYLDAIEAKQTEQEVEFEKYHPSRQVRTAQHYTELTSEDTNKGRKDEQGDVDMTGKPKLTRRKSITESEGQPYGTTIPPATWRPGVGAIKALRQKYSTKTQPSKYSPNKEAEVQQREISRMIRSWDRVPQNEAPIQLDEPPPYEEETKAMSPTPQVGQRVTARVPIVRPAPSQTNGPPEYLQQPLTAIGPANEQAIAIRDNSGRVTNAIVNDEVAVETPKKKLRGLQRKYMIKAGPTHQEPDLTGSSGVHNQVEGSSDDDRRRLAPISTMSNRELAQAVRSRNDLTQRMERDWAEGKVTEEEIDEKHRQARIHRDAVQRQGVHNLRQELEGKNFHTRESIDDDNAIARLDQQAENNATPRQIYAADTDKKNEKRRDEIWRLGHRLEQDLPKRSMYDDPPYTQAANMLRASRSEDSLGNTASREEQAEREERQIKELQQEVDEIILTEEEFSVGDRVEYLKVPNNNVEFYVSQYHHSYVCNYHYVHIYPGHVCVQYFDANQILQTIKDEIKWFKKI
jgi:hypothetical protein